MVNVLYLINRDFIPAKHAEQRLRSVTIYMPAIEFHINGYHQYGRWNFVTICVFRVWWDITSLQQ